MIEALTLFLPQLIIIVLSLIFISSKFLYTNSFDGISCIGKFLNKALISMSKF